MMPMTAAAHGSTKAHGAVMATRPASMPLTIIPGSGLPVAGIMIQNIAATAPKAAGDRGVGRHDGELDVGRRQRRGGVEAEPAEQQDERAEHRHRDVVARDACCAEPSLLYLPMRGPSTMAPASAGHAADRVHDAGAGEVDVAEAELRRCCRAWPASRRPRSRRRTAGSRWRRRTGPSRRTPSTSTARPWRRSGWSRPCP